MQKMEKKRHQQDLEKQHSKIDVATLRYHLDKEDK